MQPSGQDHRDALHAYDPSLGEPPTDACADALEASIADPELSRWWGEEKAFDAAIRAKVAGSAVPAGLQDAILAKAAALAQEDAAIATFSEPAPTRNSWHWSAFTGAAAAVAILVLAFTFVFPPQGARPSAEVASLMATLEDILEAHGFTTTQSNNYGTLVSFLEGEGAPTPKFLPESISSESGFACAYIEVDGVPVGMMCFRAEDESVFHIFTVDRKHFPEQSDMPNHFVSTIDEHCCATWTREDQIYVLATQESQDRVITML